VHYSSRLILNFLITWPPVALISNSSLRGFFLCYRNLLIAQDILSGKLGCGLSTEILNSGKSVFCGQLWYWAHKPQVCQLKPSIIFVKQTHFGSHDAIIGDVGHLHELPYSVTNVTDVLLPADDSCEHHTMTLMVFPCRMKHVCCWCMTNVITVWSW
jgi:hypothetical protein